MLAASETARTQGIVHVVPQQHVFYSDGVFQPLNFDIDINGDGTPDFTLSSLPGGGSTGVFTAIISPLGNNSVVAIPEPPPDLGYLLAAVNQGTSIGSSLTSIFNAQWYNNQTDQFGNAAIGAEALIDNQLSVIGNFAGLSSAYIGFNLVDNGNNYYGWMQVSNPLNDVYGDIVDWGYESSPNTPIEAGAVPEPSTWGLLMLGAILFFVKRKRPSFPKAARLCWNSGN